MSKPANELHDVTEGSRLTSCHGLTEFQRRILAAAIRAPSGDNCQPWRFHFKAERVVSVSADFNRAKSFFDFEHRATALSIGASIENMRVQAASEGFATELAYETEDYGQNYATLTFLRNEAMRMSQARVAALFQRTVNRRPFLPVAISPSLRARLLEEPIDGVMVQIISERHGISRWAEVIEIGDRIRYSHPEIHEELFSKLLINRRMAQDVRMGLELDRLGVGPLGGALLRGLRPWPRMQRLSRWGLVSLLARQSGFLARFSGALVLVMTRHTGSPSWVRAGEQVQRLWIKAQEHGLQTHPMPVALYLDHRYRSEGLSNFLPGHDDHLRRLRSRIESLVPAGMGVMLFRLGWGWPMRGQSVRLPMGRFLD
jgi:hypothetical protein